MFLFRLVLVYFVLIIYSKATQNTIDIIDYEQFSKNDFEILNKHKLYILLVYDIVESNNEKLNNMLNEFRNIISNLNQNNENELVVNLMIQNDQIVQRYKLTSLPKILFFRNGRHITFNNKIDLKDLEEWLDNYQQIGSFELNDSSFEHNTQATTGATTGDWFVIFHSSNCQILTRVESVWEYAATKLKGQVNFAYVDIDRNPRLKKRFNLNNSPNFYFFRQGKLFKYNIENFEPESFVSFATKFYKNTKAEIIPREVTSFDILTDDIVKLLKEADILKLSLIYGVTILGIFIILYFFLCRKSVNKLKSN